MVHLVKLVVLASAALLPALAAPLNAESNDLVAREPAPAPRAHIRVPRRRGPVSNVANRVNSVVSRVGSTASRVNSVVNRVGSTANRVNSAVNRVGSVVSGISRLFGRELDSEEELFVRELLEEFDARAPEAVHPRELEDEIEAREWFDEELD